MYYRGVIGMSLFDSVRMIEFPQRGDNRGNMAVVEGGSDIPFEIKRLFYTYGTDPTAVRGQHANRNSEFVLINVAGTCKVKVLDGRGNEAVYSLGAPNAGLYLPRMIWKDMYEFSEDSVLLCISSEHYDANEYIRDYDEFVRIVNSEG